MRALTLVGPGTFSVRTVPEPTASDCPNRAVVLRVLAGGICGSDLPYFRGQLPRLLPGTAGPNPLESPTGCPLHEVVGDVVVSRDLSLPEGSRVAGWASGTDGLAEVIVAEADGLCPVERGIDPTTAIVLQPLAAVLGAAEDLGDVRGLRVAVIGLGPIGLLFTHVLKTMGAAHVTGVDRIDRSDVASAFGVDEALHMTSQQWAARISDSDRPLLVVEAVGHQVGTLGDAVAAVAPTGRIYYFGIPDDPVYPLPMQQLLRKHLTLRAGYTRDKQGALVLAANYLDGHPDLWHNYVTHRFTMTRAQEAFEAALRPRAGQLKITLEATWGD